MAEKTVHILLVEDDEVDVMGIKRAFEKLRIANPVTVKHNGLEALEFLRKGLMPSPYLILLDLNMPRMNGIEFLTHLREDQELRNAIVFVLTTSKDQEDRLAAYNLNIAGYIVKSNIGRDFMKLVHMLDHYWRLIEFP